MLRAEEPEENLWAGADWVGLFSDRPYPAVTEIFGRHAVRVKLRVSTDRQLNKILAML